MKVKLAVIVGARPQFIKISPLLHGLKEATWSEKILIHTGQHYDVNMSQTFFDELALPLPEYQLKVGSGTHATQTGKMLIELEAILEKERPAVVIVIGDTNTTLAGALVAKKLNLPLAHIEAGLRSNNLGMPEEINRIVTDSISDFFYCPTQAALEILKKEGKTKNVENVGDLTLDVLRMFSGKAKKNSTILSQFGLRPKSYILCTLHRSGTIENIELLKSILSEISDLSQEWPILFPMHPRTQKALSGLTEFKIADTIKICQPLSFLDMTACLLQAKLVLTDSGGLQKETFLQGIPCVTLREETEWVETVQLGWNKLCGKKGQIREAVYQFLKQMPLQPSSNPYGDGFAAQKIIQSLYQYLYF